MEFKESFITRMWVAGVNTHVVTVPHTLIKEYKIKPLQNYRITIERIQKVESIADRTTKRIEKRIMSTKKTKSEIQENGYKPRNKSVRSEQFEQSRIKKY